MWLDDAEEAERLVEREAESLHPTPCTDACCSRSLPITGRFKEWAKYNGNQVAGKVYGHRDFEDGEVIISSEIVKTITVVQTYSGSFYVLEDQDVSQTQAGHEAIDATTITDR